MISEIIRQEGWILSTFSGIVLFVLTLDSQLLGLAFYFTSFTLFSSGIFTHLLRCEF